MVRQESSKPDSGSSSHDIVCFEANCHRQSIWISDFVIQRAWVQHFIHHLAPQTDLLHSEHHLRKASPHFVSKTKLNRVGFVLANGSMSPNQSGVGYIRRFMAGRKTVSFCRRNQATILEVAV